MPKKVDSKKIASLMKKKDEADNTRMRKTIHDMIHQQELPEALCDSLAYEEFDNGQTYRKYISLITSWKNKKSKCSNSIGLYQGIVDGIQGKRQWKKNSPRMVAAKKIMLSPVLIWIPTQCKGTIKSKSKSKSKRASGSVGGCDKRLRSKTKRRTKLRRYI